MNIQSITESVIKAVKSILENDNFMDDEVLADMMRDQIAHPTHSTVNSESGFVYNKLNKAGYEKLASKYWSWAAKSKENRPSWSPTIDALQDQLDKIDDEGPRLGEKDLGT